MITCSIRLSCTAWIGGYAHYAHFCKRFDKMWRDAFVTLRGKERKKPHILVQIDRYVDIWVDISPNDWHRIVCRLRKRITLEQTEMKQKNKTKPARQSCKRRQQAHRNKNTHSILRVSKREWREKWTKKRKRKNDRVQNRKSCNNIIIWVILWLRLHFEHVILLC